MGYFSNGTEGESYYGQYCSRCIHEKPNDGGCTVWLLHLLHNYEECNKPDSFLHVLIPRSGDRLSNKQCSMFVAKPALEHSNLFGDEWVPTAGMTHCGRCGEIYHGAGPCGSHTSKPNEAT